MTEPRWHDSDPRPPFGSVPGPDFRAARNRPDPTPRVYRRFGDGQPAAYDGPGWYREDPESAPPQPDSSPPARPGLSPPGLNQPGLSQPGRSQPSSSRPGPPGWTDPFSAVPMSSPGPDDGRRGGPADRGPGRRPEPGRGPLAARQPDEEPGSRPARTWRWGRMSGIQGVGIVVIAAALGALVTVATKHDPGPLLGGFVVAGTLAAGFAVRPRAAYVLIPIPVLCYLIFGLAAGLGREELNSATSGLTVDAAQWIANGFLAMAAATVLAVLITLGRWLWARHTRPVEVRPAGSRPAGEARVARLEAETRSRPADPPGRSPAGRPGGTPGGPPEPSFRPNPAWTDDRLDRGPLDQGARWAQQGESDGRGYRDQRGFGGQGGGAPGSQSRESGRRGREDQGREDRGRGGQDPGQWGRGGPGRGQGDDFWDREAPDRRWRRTGREPGDQGQGDWRRRPPSGPPSFGSRDLASGA